MSVQSQLILDTYKTDDFKPKKEPSYLLNCEDMKNHKLKIYLLNQVIQAVKEHSKKYLSIEELCSIINRNTAVKSQNRKGIVREQLKIYIENLIFYGFIDDSYSRGLVLNKSIYEELELINKAIQNDNRRSKV